MSSDEFTKKVGSVTVETKRDEGERTRPEGRAPLLEKGEIFLHIRGSGKDNKSLRVQFLLVIGTMQVLGRDENGERWIRQRMMARADTRGNGALELFDDGYWG